MNQLISSFAGSCSVGLWNPTAYALTLGPGGEGVIAQQKIPKNTWLGFLHGKLAYIWEPRPYNAEYMMLEGDTILVVNNQKTHQQQSANSILCRMRENNQAPSYVNCLLSHNTFTKEICVHTLVDIEPGEELVYMYVTEFDI